jgi:hypothetical protein
MEPQLAKLLREAPKIAAQTGHPINGQWIWKIMSPQGEVENALELQADGTRLTGRFARDASRWLIMENGKLNGDRLSFTLKRDRPDGGTMVYEMTGRLVDGMIQGTVRTEFDGNPTSSEWSARRR